MSILTDALRGKITFSQASTEAAQWASKIITKDPTLSTAASATLAIIKQGASNAIMLADTELGPHIQPAADAVELALDAALAKATGGLSVPFNPLVNAGIDQMAGLVKAAADAWALKAKASLILPAAAVQTLAGGVGGGAGAPAPQG